MENVILTKLLELEKFFDKGIVSVSWNEYNKLESVYIENYLKTEFSKRIDYLLEWKQNIGKNVYKSIRRFNYTLVDGFNQLDHLNKNTYDSSNYFEFTIELYESLIIDYLKYQIERLTEDLIERPITSNSTSKMQNLVFEWQLECKQKMISYFKEIIEINN